MNSKSTDFIFCDNLLKITDANDFIARIPVGVDTRDQLFEVLSQELKFPLYFGRTWDALWDSLCDLSWINQHRVVVAHETIPDLDAASLRTYLDLLLECINDWKQNEQHKFLVMFPEQAKDRILVIINA